jgi:hypothetical protein
METRAIRCTEVLIHPFFNGLTAPWGTTTTGWSNQPPTTTQSQKILPQSTSTVQNYEVDVTDFVQGWVANASTNHGMLLKLQSEVYYNSMIF